MSNSRKRSEPQTFILKMNGDRTVLFTPEMYDVKTGMLHGNDDGGKPVSISVGRSLVPYQPIELEWDDD